MGLISELVSGGAEGIFKGVSAVVKDFKADPTEVAKLNAALAQAQLDLQSKLIEADAKALESVNATIREEAKSEHWAVWLWRPSVGFTFCFVLINNYVLMPYFSTYGLKPVDIPGEVWSAILVVLGAASATRGWEKVTRLQQQNGK